MNKLNPTFLCWMLRIHQRYYRKFNCNRTRLTLRIQYGFYNAHRLWKITYRNHINHVYSPLNRTTLDGRNIRLREKGFFRQPLSRVLSPPTRRPGKAHATPSAPPHVCAPFGKTFGVIKNDFHPLSSLYLTTCVRTRKSRLWGGR